MEVVLRAFMPTPNTIGRGTNWLVGAWFDNHPPIQPATIQVYGAGDPATTGTRNASPAITFEHLRIIFGKFGDTSGCNFEC